MSWRGEVEDGKDRGWLVQYREEKAAAAITSTSARSLSWVLWHHNGGSTPVEPLRFSWAWTSRDYFTHV